MCPSKFATKFVSCGIFDITGVIELSADVRLVISSIETYSPGVGF
jgi:hypothetical protein